MADGNLFAPYIPRDEERDILAAADLVRASGNSQVLLLYGAGGVGKTRLVRALAEQRTELKTVVWLRPVDLDDQEYYLLTNLQAHVARELDPAGEYFGTYYEYLAHPTPSGEHITQDTIVSHIGFGRQVFLECYAQFVHDTRKTVVIVFDTVEAVRGSTLFNALAQWMHALPATLFILSGRPATEGEGDAIATRLAEHHRPMPVTSVPLGEFDPETAKKYLLTSRIATGVTEDQREKIVILTGGHPLWLAVALSYLDDIGVPPELSASLAAIRRDIPVSSPATIAGAQREEDFKSRLMSSYREADFWHEAVKRIAALRMGVNEAMWRDLMHDRPLPPDAATLEEAWRKLPSIPWIRVRANGAVVTVHDAMAEELSKRIIPLRDQSWKWRRSIWDQAAANCDRQIAGLESRYAADTETLDSRRQLTVREGSADAASDFSAISLGPIVAESARLDSVKRAIDQLKAQRLYYRLLSDFEVGCQYFLDLFGQAKRGQDLLFQDLLATVMRRCLTADHIPGGFEDVDSGVIAQFRDWLATGRQPLYREVSLVLADFLITSGQSHAAIDTLSQLPTEEADVRQLSRQKILLGNAYLRVPGRAKEGLPYLQQALTVAKDEIPSVERSELLASAYKELGFYYRSVGQWRKADDAYEHAWIAIRAVRATEQSNESRRELASIQTNWAYVKGLLGAYTDALGLVESAIDIRQDLKLPLEEGASHSVHGEILRYQQRFGKAWEAYAKAERIFKDPSEPSWLGTVYQEQAICLYQAYLEDERLLGDKDQLAAAREQIEEALEICREQSLRNYPSALNRAARIVGHTDPDAGLELLARGIAAGREMSDGWFWLANLVEYAELSYRTLMLSGDLKYREEIVRYQDDLKTAIAEFDFPDLQGRAEIVQAHLAVYDWAKTGDVNLLGTALLNYSEGFRRIAERGYVGSSGVYVIPSALKTFRQILRRLPEHIQSQWRDTLQVAWADSKAGSLMLLTRLDER